MIVRYGTSQSLIYWSEGRFFFMAKRWLSAAKRRFAAVMDLPQDIMLELPRITMIGDIHIYIENHKGILVFSDTELRLMLKQGHLLIKGNKFILKTILPEEILLEGEIHQVLFIDQNL